MAAPVLTRMPESFHAGATVEYTVTHSNYPADDGWSLKLYLAGVHLITPISASTSGKGFVVALTAAVTAKLAAGVYSWQEWVSKSGKDYLADSGKTEVFANIKAALAGDFQSWEEQALEAVKAALTGTLTANQRRFVIHNRQVDRYELSELLQLKATLESSLRGQKRPGTFGQAVDFRFVEPRP